MLSKSIVTPEFQKLTNGHLNKDSINSQLTNIENALQQDTQLIDQRMVSLQEYVLDLKTQVQSIKSIIPSEKDPSRRANLYKLINTSLELIANFEGLLLKSLEVKNRYRQEFINSVHRKIKLFEIDLKQMEDSIGELNTVGLIKIVNALQQSFDRFSKNNTTINNNLNNDENLTEEDKQIAYRIDSINNDETYSLR